MAKHLGWKRNDFFIGDVKMAEARITRKKVRVGNIWTVKIRRHERSTDGNILRTTRRAAKFDNKAQASLFLQNEKSRISQDFKMWMRLYG